MSALIAQAPSAPRMALNIVSSKTARIALAVLLVASLLLNGYYFAVAGRINGDLAEAGIVSGDVSGGALGLFEMSVLQENVRSVALTAAEAGQAVQQLQAALAAAQAAAAAGQ